MPPAQTARRRLRRWITDNGIGPREVARRLACNHASVIAWRDGARVPTALWRAAIERLTGIPAASWASDRELRALANVATGGGAGAA